MKLSRSLMLCVGAVLVMCCLSARSASVEASATAPGTFIRNWLICGEFPNPPHAGDEYYNHTRPCVGLDTDYLKEHGGETAIVPEAGMKHTRPDGTEAVWFEHSAATNIVDLCDLLKARSTRNVVAYGFAYIKADQGGDYLLAMGSDDGIRVWLNGVQVHDKLASRGTTPDEDIVAVVLKKGLNSVLVKVEQGAGGWSFALRALGAQAVLRDVEYDIERLKARVTLTGSKAIAGKTMQLVHGDTVLAETKVGEAANGLAIGKIEIPLSYSNREHADTVLVVDGQEKGPVQVPRIDEQLAAGFLREELVLGPTVFSDTTFPKAAFRRPLLVEGLIGPFSLRTTYYDKDFNAVSKAATPGRYGAVVEITTGNGFVTRRFRTLYRQPEPVDWRRYSLAANIALPAELGVPPEAAASYSNEVADFIKWQVVDSFSRGDYPAVLFAGLNEVASSAPKDDFYGSPHNRDRRWWVGLQRRLDGLDKRFPDRFVCPKKIKGKPAPVVREGTLEEAGMTAEGIRAIDAVLTEWERNCDEAFAVCIVRHGVIALHKAYGTRDGKPMTVTTKSWMASSTKMLSSTLLMMFVDQGILDLDDRVDGILPPLKGREAKKPMTFRHLNSITGGINPEWWTWGKDLVEKLAVVFPYCDVAGESCKYQGTGFELTANCLELISGESLPNLYRTHLLEPLGCENTQIGNASSWAESVPLDVARICQMLMNKGAYGNLQFMRPETFERMLPRKMSEVLECENPDDVPISRKFEGFYGIGTHRIRKMDQGEGLSPSTFHHAGASGPNLFMDPENDLIIAMTRNSGGKKFATYHQPFIDAVIAALAK